jgi:hypothetical protein
LATKTVSLPALKTESLPALERASAVWPSVQDGLDVEYLLPGSTALRGS